ncbi:MAG: cation transporter, partial [Lachnospiraceae bacterium]|nr:cation transporter [Lachnospiraceae bacterium]
MEQYKVDGMTCAACVAHVEKAVKSVEGVEEVSVSLLTNSMGVSGNADAASICKAVENAGYHAEKKGAEKTGKTRLNHDADVAPDVMRSQMDGFIDRETPNMVNRLVLSVLFLLPLMYLSMGHMMWKFPLPGFLDRNYIGIALTEMILAFVIMYINRRFFISGWKSTMHLAP